MGAVTAPQPSRWAGALRTAPPVAALDLPAWVGQVTTGYRFYLVDGPTGARRGRLTPMASAVPTLTHDSTRTIPRSLTLELGAADTARVNPVRDRVLPVMVAGGVEYPLGRYMWGDQSRVVFSSGDLSSAALVDEMWIVDQEATAPFSAGSTAETDAGVGEAVVGAVRRLLDPLPVVPRIDPSDHYTIGTWAPGTSQAAILRELAVDGDYLSPWMDNAGRLRMIRTFDPRGETPLLDWDAGTTVLAETVTRTDNLLTAPNKWVVVGNGAGSEQAAAAPIVGVYDVPSAAPHSIVNRGFVIARVEERQVASAVAATQVAATLAARDELVEVVELSTAPDPRHDGHTVIRWQGEIWQELGWSLVMEAGQPMRHTIRRVYR